MIVTSVHNVKRRCEYVLGHIEHSINTLTQKKKSHVIDWDKADREIAKLNDLHKMYEREHAKLSCMLSDELVNLYAFDPIGELLTLI